MPLPPVAELNPSNPENFETKGGRFKVYYGDTSLCEEQVVSYTLLNDSQWKQRSLAGITTRYLNITRESTEKYYWQQYGPYNCHANIMEVVIYGKPMSEPAPKPVRRNVSGNTRCRQIGKAAGTLCRCESNRRLGKTRGARVG